LNQISLVKDFFQNTINDLSSLEDGWLEKRAEAKKLKKLYKMLKNEFKVEKNTNKTVELKSVLESPLDSPEAIPLRMYTDMPEKSKEEKELLEQDIKAIQEQKKAELKK
jgi:hypothetical protein